ncbi:hypothetical protein IQ07DRAFT_591227 [Pyrenochaeta sp. DS3sAY3a]|nr:hypothetical protein IQ07DRAFT_591227 [Pyrenochaeta sp. DS3sAY3a]
MHFSHLLFRLALLFTPVALLGTAWLQLYPVLHGCAFPTPPPSHAHSIAPFRLLALGDPQLEGDSSLPDPNALVFPSLENLISHLRNASTHEERQSVLAEAAKGVLQDATRWLEGKRKAVDLWGNDWYLAHIVQTLCWWTEPTHISVLGDLLGSQWVTDGEFEKRAGRYWNIVMRGLTKVPDTIFGVQQVDEVTTLFDETLPDAGEEAGHQEEEPAKSAEQRRKWGGTTEVLGADKNWAKRVINIVGNHDVGYAGDIDESRIDRFEKAFGSVNWDIWFTLPQNLKSSDPSHEQDPGDSTNTPALRLVILNSMNLDTPAWSSDLQGDTYSFVNHIITSSRPVTDKTHATVLLTHIPLEKEAGICADSPFFDFFEGGHGVKEQNMLSDHASKIALEGIFGMSGNKDAMGAGMGRHGIIVNGHDHEGCDVVHWIRQPGVDQGCRVEDLKKEQAYWPIPTLNNSIPLPTVELDGTDVGIPSLEHAGNESTNDTEVDETESLSQPIPDSIPISSESDTAPKWKAHRFPNLPYEVDERDECTVIDKSPRIREITLRSMMGEFGGYAGFLSAWYDHSIGDNGEWVFDFATCGLGVQHWWWTIYILDLAVSVLLVSLALLKVVEKISKNELSFEVDRQKKSGIEMGGRTSMSSQTAKT